MDDEVRTYLDLLWGRLWRSSLQRSDFPQMTCRRHTEGLRPMLLLSCNNHTRLILAASPLPCSLISGDRAHNVERFRQLFAEQKRGRRNTPNSKKILQCLLLQRGKEECYYRIDMLCKWILGINVGNITCLGENSPVSSIQSSILQVQFSLHMLVPVLKTQKHSYCVQT